MKPKQRNSQIDAAINGRGAASYKDMFLVKELSSYKSGYRKPTRKATMGRALYGGKDTVTERESGNALVEAMGSLRFDGQAVFRPSARLPPVYQEQLKDLEQAVKGIESYNSMILQNERAMNHNDHNNSETTNNNFKLKFSSLVQKQRSEYPYGESLLSQAKRELHAEEKRNAEEEKAKSGLIAPFIHKTSWMQDVIKKEFVHRRKADLPFVMPEEQQDLRESTSEKKQIREILQNATQIGGKSADSYLTQNVYYMLQIWQNSENTDLEKVLSDSAKTKGASIKQNRSRSQSTSKQLKSREDFLSLGKLDSIADGADLTKENRILSQKAKAVNTKTISKSTIRQLRKLLNDAEGTRGSSSSFIDMMIKKTLTGTEEGEPEVIPQIPLLGSVTNSSISVKKPRKPAGNPSLGGVAMTMTEHEIEEANKKFIIELSDPIDDDAEENDDIYGGFALPESKQISKVISNDIVESPTQSQSSLSGDVDQHAYKRLDSSRKQSVSIDITEDLFLKETLFALPALVLECMFIIKFIYSAEEGAIKQKLHVQAIFFERNINRARLSQYTIY